MVNTRTMKCGRTVLAWGMENSYADRQAKSDECIRCQEDLGFEIVCEYKKEYLFEQPTEHRER